MAKRDNKIWIALGISLALLGSIIAVNYFYGWGNVYEDVKSMGKSVWFAFSDWVGVKNGNETVIMPEEFVENESIVDTGSGLQDVVERIPFINRAVDLGSRVLNRITNDLPQATQVIRDVNMTALANQLSQTVGAGVEFVSVTLSAGRELLLPLENYVRRGLGEAFDQFLIDIRNDFDELLSMPQMLLRTIIEIPQGIIQNIRNTISSSGAVSYTTPSARVEDGRLVGTPISKIDVDAMTGAW